MNTRSCWLDRNLLVLAMAAVLHGTAGAQSWNFSQLIQDPEPASSYRFGSRVAIEGSTAVALAPGDGELGLNAGAAYVFRRQPSSTMWVPVQKLLAADGTPGDDFGRSLAIDDNTLVVGVPLDDQLAFRAGSAYVFERANVHRPWKQVAKLLSPDASQTDHFGHSVSVSGTTIVVGALGEDGQAQDSGAAYVFDRLAPGWTVTQKLTAIDGASLDQFGYSLAIDDDVVVIGASKDDVGLQVSGSAYIFERPPGMLTWTETKKLVSSTPATSICFGDQIDLNRGTILVGDYGDSELGIAAGAAYVFERDYPSPGNWGEVVKLTASDGVPNDRFGVSVSLDGDLAVIGALNGDGHVPDSGSVYLFQRGLPPLVGWTELQELQSPHGQPGTGSFALSVAAAGKTVLVGAPYDQVGVKSGAVYAFDQP